MVLLGALAPVPSILASRLLFSFHSKLSLKRDRCLFKTRPPLLVELLLRLLLLLAALLCSSAQLEFSSQKYNSFSVNGAGNSRQERQYNFLVATTHSTHECIFFNSTWRASGVPFAVFCSVWRYRFKVQRETGAREQFVCPFAVCISIFA